MIEHVYQRFEAADNVQRSNLLKLDIPELEQYMLKVLRERIGAEKLEITSDFFEAGIDSLQAITARSHIVHEIDTGHQVPGQNVIFECSNIQNLAKHIYSLRTSGKAPENDELQVMSELINKYSSFPERKPGSIHPDGETVILTGATGSLGTHILAQLVKNNDVKTIYCLVRASSDEAAASRVFDTLASKGLPSLSDSEQAKVVSLPADLSHPRLGLADVVYQKLSETLTTVIHSAWAVNFNLGVKSFESHHIRGTFNLLNTCLDTQTVNPARFFFCSSVSAAAGTPSPATVPETYVEDLSHAHAMGYARSKCVTEHVVKAAIEKTAMTAAVLRLGQIIGDTKNGLWNMTEAIPSMIQGVNSIRALPALGETPSWMPADKMAEAVLELVGLSTQSPSVTVEDLHELQASDSRSMVVYHVQNTQLFHWTQELLPALRSAGLDFETVSQRDWVRRLKDAALSVNQANAENNPVFKLVSFFENKYDHDGPGRETLVFETKKTEARSSVVHQGFDVIGSGIVTKMVSYWKSAW